MIYSKEEINELIEKYTRQASDITAIADVDRHATIIKPFIELAYQMGKAVQCEIEISKQEYQERKHETNTN